jgi:hypothetical protein
LVKGNLKNIICIESACQGARLGKGKLIRRLGGGGGAGRDETSCRCAHCAGAAGEGEFVDFSEIQGNEV